MKAAKKQSFCFAAAATKYYYIRHYIQCIHIFGLYL